MMKDIDHKGYCSQYIHVNEVFFFSSKIVKINKKNDLHIPKPYVFNAESLVRLMVQAFFLAKPAWLPH